MFFRLLGPKKNGPPMSVDPEGSPLALFQAAATIKPTNPDAHLNVGDQNLCKDSEITQSPIERPKRSSPIPRPSPKIHRVTA